MRLKVKIAVILDLEGDMKRYVGEKINQVERDVQQTVEKWIEEVCRKWREMEERIGEIGVEREIRDEESATAPFRTQLFDYFERLEQQNSKQTEHGSHVDSPTIYYPIKQSIFDAEPIKKANHNKSITLPSRTLLTTSRPRTSFRTFMNKISNRKTATSGSRRKLKKSTLDRLFIKNSKFLKN
jgi:hypothetical protein